MSLDELLVLLKQQQHTGPITIHLLHGTPKRVEVPRKPQQIGLDSGGEPATLDTVV